MKKILVLGIFLSIVILISLALIISLNNEEVIANDIYSNLPERPNNFEIVMRDITRGALSDLCSLDQSYYLQPEFYPTWSKSLSDYTNHDYTRWGVYGYGAFPSEQGIEVSNLKKGEEITFCTYFKTSYNIESYQGIKLTGTDNEYFDVYVDPSMFITPPTFPEFSEDWVRRIKVVITAKKDIPVDNYMVGFTVEAPPAWFKEQSIWNIINQQESEEYERLCSKDINDEKCQELYNNRKFRYVNGGTWNTGGHVFKANINVI